MSLTWADHLLDPKHFAHCTGMAFRGLTISATATGFNVVVRAETRDGNPVYAMTQHDDPLEGMRVLWGVITGRNGTQMWRRDRFAR